MVHNAAAIGFSDTLEKFRYFVYSEIVRRWPMRLNRVFPKPDSSKNKEKNQKYPWSMQCLSNHWSNILSDELKHENLCVFKENR